MKKLLFFLISITLYNSVFSQGGIKLQELTSVPNLNGDKIKLQLQITEDLIKKYPNDEIRIKRGVLQTGSLWNDEDGTIDEFKKFCIENFTPDGIALERLYKRITDNFEVINGHFNKISVDLKKPQQVVGYDLLPIDNIFAAYEPSAHQEDFYINKIAFIIKLNFPSYTLSEKNDFAESWSRKQWAFARLGEYFISRIPAIIMQKYFDAYQMGDAYISDYNIYMGSLLNNFGKIIFPQDMKLISHWGLRDELKANYGKENGLEKQKIIYEVMKNIITQNIPENVINSDKFTWNPFSGRVFEGDKEISVKSEPNTRYQHLLNNFKAMQALDKYYPQYPTYIQRKFELEMEIAQPQLENLFSRLCGSPQVKKVADIIAKRLGRSLQPFDIWYDGFKARNSLNEDALSSQTKKLYPNSKAFAATMPALLQKLGFAIEKANFISSKIEVEPARGSGQAIGSEMKTDNAHLQSRISAKGMDYKGYNIAVHEFGHNVEQTISLHDVDYYSMKGVPNTAFTEAWAFVFQKRDLDLLDVKNENPNKKYETTLDIFWGVYEIMGVSLVDMNVWKWLYEHPNANSLELRNAVVTISKDIWNRYFAKVFGSTDEPILGIYSHMIDNPLYLSAYPVGHLVEFQIEKAIEGKNLGIEMQRMISQGRLTPQVWMKGAVGDNLTLNPLLEAVNEAIEKVK
ncbi:MAG: hypothetical protein NT007_16540 [Candidatus Kapabacteria bacterium]|nr:hypothetical protein [Candidatus Kapabacteria bacterium]